MLRNTLRLLLLLFLSAGLVEARIGDTKKEAEAHYGSGKDIGWQEDLGGQVLYTTPDYAITATFDAKGKITMEIFATRAQTDGTRADFTPDQLNALLKEEGAGQDWLKGVKEGKTVWCRSDNQIFAQHHDDRKILLFLSPANPAVAAPHSLQNQEAYTTQPPSEPTQPSQP